ncbi:hypothetical protein N9B25_01635, partial [bacterium]|nr:hypothetical protein [bacterium]
NLLATRRIDNTRLDQPFPEFTQRDRHTTFSIKRMFRRFQLQLVFYDMIWLSPTSSQKQTQLHITQSSNRGDFAAELVSTAVKAHL